VSRNRLSDEELDALLVRAISRLPSERPARGFADRVLARVRLPGPGPVALLGRLRAWVSHPTRPFALAASYAVVAVVALALVVPWLATHSTAIGYALDWMVARSLVLVREVALGAAGWAVSSGIAGVVDSAALSGPRLWLGGLVLTAGYALSAAGLGFLLRAPRRKDAYVRIQA
jgi:hypothetical protein